MSTTKTIKNFPKYTINTLGEIISYQKSKKGTPLTSCINSAGYYHVGLYNNDKRCNCNIHRLLAETFIDNIDLLKCVNHINGDKTDNRLINLEWVSYSGNRIHAVDTGLAAMGEDHGKSVLTKNEVLSIRESYGNESLNTIELAEKFNVSTGCISMVVRNVTWKDVNYSYIHEGKLLGVGENHPMSKLNEQNVKDIRVEYSQGNTSYKKLAIKYSVDKALIGRIVRRLLWKHVD